MSGHGHDDGEAGNASEHEHEDETSSDDFPADEPRSPGWLPLLGGALFLAAIFVFVAMGSGSKTAEELASDAAAANPGASAAGSAPAAPGGVQAPTVAPARRPAPAIPVGAALPANHPQLAPGAGN